MPVPKPATFRAGLPVVLVMTLLLSLIVVPIVTQRRIARIRSETSEPAQPARNQIVSLQLGSARAAAATRSFVLTGDTMARVAREQALQQRRTAYSRLLPLARRLGPSVYAEVIRIGGLMRSAEAVADSLHAGQISGSEYQERIPEQDLRAQRIAASAERMEDEIDRIVLTASEETAAIERTGALIIVLLALLSIVAVLLVARLGRGYRLLADRLKRRSRWREAVNEAARELGAVTTLDEATRVAVNRAAATTRAIGTYIELSDVDDPEGGEVEVVAAAGTGGPPPHTRVPYPGSLSQKVIDSGEPAVFGEIAEIGEGMAPYLKESCRDCIGLVLPLSKNTGFLGALVLLRDKYSEPFGEDETAYLRALADIVVATIRRVRLLEELTETERRYRQIADHLREVIWLGTPDLSQRFFVNPAYEKIFGQPLEKFLYEPGETLALVHPEDRARVEREMKEIPFGGYDITYRIIRPDGTMRWIGSRAYPIRDERGNVYRVAGIMEDMTRQKEIEEEREELLRSAREAHDKMIGLLESMQEGFYALDDQERFTYVNHQAEQILRTSREDLLGRVIWDRDPYLKETPAYENFRRALRERVPVQFINYDKRLDLWTDVRANPHAGGLSVLFQDITERRRAEAERERLLERERQARHQAEKRGAELARVTESRATLMRGFSHDVKNPLSAADGYLQLFEQGLLGELEDKQVATVHKIRHSIGAALALIEDLLALARAEAGQIELEVKSTDVPTVVREAADEYRAQAEAKGLTMTVDTGADIPIIQSDPERIHQIIGNLLSNAVKYTPHGGVTISVHTRENGAPRRGRWVAIDVCDTGPGIPEDQQKMIFDEFRRAPAGQAEAGAGIGLAIAKRIARALGGEITLVSQVGAGSTFTLWLPA